MEQDSSSFSSNRLQSTFCHTGESCDIKDEDTWLNFDYEDGFVEEFNDDNFIVELPDDEVLNMIELNIQGGNIENRFCDILPPSYDTSNLNFNNIIENSIGHIAPFDDYIFDTLLTSDYNEQLDSLKIVGEDISNIFICPTRRG